MSSMSSGSLMRVLMQAIHVEHVTLHVVAEYLMALAPRSNSVVIIQCKEYTNRE